MKSIGTLTFITISLFYSFLLIIKNENLEITVGGNLKLDPQAVFKKRHDH